MRLEHREWCYRELANLYKYLADHKGSAAGILVKGVQYEHNGEQTDGIVFDLGHPLGHFVGGEPEGWRGPQRLTAKQKAEMNECISFLWGRLRSDNFACAWTMPADQLERDRHGN